jgi:hypothetical protein
MADSIDKLRDGQPDGSNNKSNLKDWSDYAKRNSFDQRASKAQSKADLAPAGGPHGRESDWKADDWRQPQKQSEGKCYTITNDLAAKNSYTSAKGTKHD